MIEYSTSSADGTVLFGRHWPVDAPKAVMILVHGFGEHCGRYAHMAAHLNANEIAVIALDLHGHGHTPGKRGVVKSYEDFRDDLAALIAKTTELYPNTPQALYGHSMGGGIVLDHGARKLDTLPIIASAPFIVLSDPIPSVLRVLVKLMGRLMPKGAMSQPIDSTKISNLETEQNLYLKDPLNHGKLSFRLAEAMVTTGERLSQDAKIWDRPLLLLHSKEDQLTSYQASEGFSKTAKQCEFHAFETVQHEMHNDTSRDDVYALMTTFILHQTKKLSS